MALQVVVTYKTLPLVYDVTRQEDQVYHLRLQEQTANSGENYVPQKLVIRKKGKIWISDLENYRELVGKLTDEILSFHPANKLSA